MTADIPLSKGSKGCSAGILTAELEKEEAAIDEHRLLLLLAEAACQIC